MAKSKKNISPGTSSKGLTLTIPKQQALSKSQQNFNRLVKRIENLQHEITETNRLLGEKLEIYGQQIHPVEKQLVAHRKQVVKLLFPFYLEKKLLPKRDKHILKDILTLQLNNIFAFDDEDLDDELKQVFEALQGISYEDAEKQDATEMKQEMEAVFESMSFKMDFGDINGNMTEEEMARKMKEMEEQIFGQFQNFSNKQTTRKKTKKQLEKEEREKLIAETKNKSIGRIYKQLAKVLHPDLEHDEEQKSLKELRMRELTSAYEKKDLHTLLRLELEWIQKEENNLDTLTEEKLSIYNDVLKEQISELEQEKQMLWQHPRYQPLHKYIMFPEQLKFLNLTREKKDLNENLKALEKSIAKLQSDKALDEVKEAISIFRQYRF